MQTISQVRVLRVEKSSGKSTDSEGAQQLGMRRSSSFRGLKDQALAKGVPVLLDGLGPVESTCVFEALASMMYIKMQVCV